MPRKILIVGGIGIAALVVASLSFWLSKQAQSPVADVRDSTIASPETNGKVESETVAVSPTKVPHPVSLPALMATIFDGRDLQLVRVLENHSAYTRHYITYKSGELTISGIMNIPKGAGPFPVLILNHGHIDTSVYTNGRGLKREQDYLARQGFAVLHPDYRNHAQSSKDHRDTLAVRLGYVEDVINAVYAVRAAGISGLDVQRIGMLGHSMGGGITLSALVTAPELIDAAVLYAPVSGDMRKSYERWIARESNNAVLLGELYGTPEANPTFWNNLSAETFYEKVQAPVKIFHGTADDSVPIAWSQETQRLLKAAQKEVSLVTYPGAPHEFTSTWVDFMQKSTAFFKASFR